MFCFSSLLLFNFLVELKIFSLDLIYLCIKNTSHYGIIDKKMLIYFIKYQLFGIGNNKY